jgi:hypothetical protein
LFPGKVPDGILGQYAIAGWDYRWKKDIHAEPIIAARRGAAVEEHIHTQS